MDYIEMTENTQSDKVSGNPIWEYSAVIDATTNPVIIPDGGGVARDWLIAIFVPLAGSGSIEYSLSNREDIKAGTGKWRPWENGTVLASADDLLGPVNAIRCIYVSGSFILEVTAS